ncbi:polyprotein [Anagyris vein yellowing virus]|uniref:Non-structural replication polyprotein n=1 Tax=Anagyris vein yellowing virus TaxID=312275 RepID=Q3BD93_9VIRU|nr:polyprotein [Anagyris vein yellowing virus]AAW88529.1 polyprotein [Anagyris vein yellowing virus]
MSFQLALDALSSTVHRDASLNPVLNSLVQPLQSSLTQFPWIIQKEHIPFLIASGIPSSGFGSTPHPHAVHKVIETFLLFNHWSHLASLPSTVMFMKPSKFRKLSSVNPNFTELINYRLTDADSVRYPTTSLTLPTKELVFMHDALMYFTPAQVLDLFIKAPHLQRLHCSLVVPPESSFTDLSLYPSVYTYTISGNSLHYVPEGHHAGSYNQPLTALNWLKICQIKSPYLNLSVKVLESWGPCHSILIQRGLPLLSGSNLETISFKIPDCLELPEATFLHQPLRHRLVPREVYDSLFTYTRAVRTLRTSDPAGFVRTHSNKPQYAWVIAQAWDNLQTYALLNSPIRPKVIFDFFLNPLGKFKLFLSQHLHPFLVVNLRYLGLIPPIAKLLLKAPSVPKVEEFHLLFQKIKGPKGLLNLEKFPPGIAPLLTKLNSKLKKGNVHPLLYLALGKLNLLNQKPELFYLRTCLKQLSWPSLTTTALISGLFPLLSLLLQASSPVSLQTLHDAYHSHLHPPQFHLSWRLQPLEVAAPSEFLPLSLQSGSAPTELPLIVPPFPPASVQTVTAEPAPQAPQASIPAPPQDPSNVASSSGTAQGTQAPVTLEPSSSGSQDLANNSLAAESSEPPQHLRSINECGALNQVPLDVPSEILNESSPKGDFPPSTLLDDPSCSGPVVDFDFLHPADYHNSNGSFQTRQRCQGKSQAQFPEKSCLLTSLSSQLDYTPSELRSFLCEMLPDSLLSNQEVKNYGLSTDHLTALSFRIRFECLIHTTHAVIPYGIKNSTKVVNITYFDGPQKHFEPHIKLIGSAPGSNPSKSNLVRSALRFQYNGSFLPFYDAHPHKISVMHAKNLVSNMKNGFDGISSKLVGISDKSPRAKLFELDSMIDVSFPRTVDVIHIAGFPGCGKSHPMQKLLKTKPFKHFRLSVPTNELRSEWKRDLDLPESESWRLCTWETALFKTSSILVIDEVYKLPRGYLDLILLSDPSIQLAIILGDPLQGEYHSTHPSSSNARLPSETLRLSKYIDCYCWWTYRCPKVVANLFGVKTFSDEEGFIHSAITHPPNLPNLVNSIATANTMQSLGHHALTISSSQGMTYSSPVTILLDRHSTLLSPHNGLVALTRSRKGVIFIGNMYQASGHFGTSYMFTRALTQTPIDMISAFPIFHTLPLMHEPITSRRHRLVAGNTVSSPTVNSWALQHLGRLPPHFPVTYDKDVLLSNPILQSSAPEQRLSTLHLPPTRLPLHRDIESCNPSTSSCQALDLTPSPISHGFYGESFEELAAHFMPAHDPDLKEVLVSDQRSNQFPYLDVPFSLSCQPSSLLAASHKPAKDPTLLINSIKKRLRFRKSGSPYTFTPNDLLLGVMLFESWCKAYCRNPKEVVPFNPALFAECILNEYAQLSSKTQSAIVANASRSDPDWRYTCVRIFAKSQHKVNDGSIFGGWKACQTLALMHDFVVLSLGPVKKYQRIIDHYDRPGFIYSHCGKTPSDLSKWSQEYLRGTEYICNDYTSFDQSQHGEAVIFETLKMRRVSIPDCLIELHMYLKTNVSTQFGPLTCMRLTGEPGTYDDNTDYNLAVLFSQYSISSQPIMVSGDDSVICGLPPTNPSWAKVSELLHLSFKTERTPKPLFCGYYVGPNGCCRNPFALFAKLMISYDLDTLPETLPSYIYEFSIGHRLGDSVQNLFSPSLLPYYSACFDLFCRRCPPSQKVILSFEPIPESFFSKALANCKWVSKTLFSELPGKIRESLVATSRLPNYHSDPKVQYLESELLLSFNNHG